jgi:hypothetical protein
MATRDTKFLLKRSNVPGKIPPSSALTEGEIALNTADAILYTSGSTQGQVLPIGWDRVHRTGDTMTGTLYVPTISASTYQNLPIDIRVTGGTYSNNTFTYTNNTGGTFNVLFNSVTGLTINGNLTITGTTSSNTVSATTYQNLPIEIQAAASDETTSITTGTTKVTFRSPCGFTLTGVRASLTTAQTSGNIFTVDINLNGTSVLSTKITIDNTEKTSTTAATPPVISTSSIPDDGEISVDVDQIGDGTAKGLKVTLLGVRS